MSFNLGLCSISFRKNTPQEILTEMKNAGLIYIEWGSDVHAPQKDIEKLTNIANLQKEYNIKCSSYGTYFRIGVTPTEELQEYINAAKILGTNVLRLWCGNKNSQDYSAEEKTALFLNAIMEVSNGCKVCSQVISLPLISAILGFGSFSVICQVSPYLKACKVKMKNFFVSRILNASLSAFFTFNLIKLFPEAVNTSVVFHVNNQPLNLSYTVASSIFLLIMCLIFVLQVDNRKKVC